MNYTKFKLKQSCIFLYIMSGKEDAFFKIRPTKKSNPEERTTLDVIHQSQLKRIQDERYEVQLIQEDINSITSGGTLTAVLFGEDGFVYTAAVGDSRAVLQ